MSSWHGLAANTEEVYGSEKVSYQENEISATVRLRVPYADAGSICADMMGNSRPWPKWNTGAIPRCIKADYMHEAGALSTPGLDLIVYDYAIITANYSLKAPDPEELFIETLEPTVEFITQDPQRFRWGTKEGDILADNEAPGKQLYQMVLNKKFLRLDSLPESIFNSGGHVNENEYTSQKYQKTFDAETLLFVPPKTEESFTTDGSEGFSCECQWVYKPEGWNKYWRSKTETWEEIWDFEAEAPYKQYPTDPFTDLLV